jgi:hypothetical protein
VKTRIVEQYLNEHNELVLVDELGNEHEAPLEPVHLGRWRAIAVWIIAFSVVAVLMYTANRHRINDIQQSRVYSCVQNYNGLAKVFEPFRPPGDNPNTPRNEADDFRKFDNTIRRLKRQCVAQVDTKRRVKTTPLTTTDKTVTVTTGDGK